MNAPEPKPAYRHTLHINLEPETLSSRIWRRIAIRSNNSLADLHHVIQAAFGWESLGCHEYRNGDLLYAPASAGIIRLPKNIKFCDEQDAILGEVLNPGDIVTYIYDSNSSWECISWKHVITVESIEGIDEPLQFKEACVIDGENASPPEDVGNAKDYKRLLSRVTSNLKEERQTFEWDGEEIDPSLWSKRWVNTAIARYFNLKEETDLPG